MREILGPWRYGRACVRPLWPDLTFGPRYQKICVHKRLWESLDKEGNSWDECQSLSWPLVQLLSPGARGTSRNKCGTLEPAWGHRRAALGWFVGTPTMKEKLTAEELKRLSPTWSFLRTSSNKRERVGDGGCGPSSYREKQEISWLHLCLQGIVWERLGHTCVFSCFPEHLKKYILFFLIMNAGRDGKFPIWVTSLATKGRRGKEWFPLPLFFQYLLQHSWFHTKHATSYDHRVVLYKWFIFTFMHAFAFSLSLSPHFSLSGFFLSPYEKKILPTSVFNLDWK